MKYRIMRIALIAVFPALFSVYFFLLSGGMNAPAGWIGYGFVLLGYAAAVLTHYLRPRFSRDALLGFTSSAMAAGYFTVQLIIGVLCIQLKPSDIGLCVGVQVILALLYAGVVLALLLTDVKTALQAEKRQQEVIFAKTAAFRIQSMMGKIDNVQVNAALEEAYDELHASPTRSHPSVATVEAQILEAITQLEQAVERKDIQEIVIWCAQMVDLADQRNGMLRLTY